MDGGVQTLSRRRGGHRLDGQRLEGVPPFRGFHQSDGRSRRGFRSATGTRSTAPCSNRTYTRTTMVRHQGAAPAFALDRDRLIVYTVFNPVRA